MHENESHRLKTMEKEDKRTVVFEKSLEQMKITLDFKHLL
jgi:hypothetical protein